MVANGQVLLPIVTSPAFDVHGPVVHAALMRLADVIQASFVVLNSLCILLLQSSALLFCREQGKPDYMYDDILQDRLHKWLQKQLHKSVAATAGSRWQVGGPLRLQDVPPTDEAGPWPGLTVLYRHRALGEAWGSLGKQKRCVAVSCVVDDDSASGIKGKNTGMR